MRDELLGRPVTDVDVAVAGDAEAGRPRAGPQRSAARCSRCPSASAPGARSTATPGCTYDVSALQGETIEEDLARRDFSVNAMARPLEGGAVIDPEGGARDLEGGCCGCCRARPTRRTRCARCAWRAWPPSWASRPTRTRSALTREAAPRLAEASAERVFAELGG